MTEHVEQPAADLPPLDPLVHLRYILFLGARPEEFDTGLLCLKNVEEFGRHIRKLRRVTLQKTKDALAVACDIVCAEFNSSHSVVADLVSDGRHEEVLQCLKAAASKESCCWQEIVGCLALMLHGEHANEKASAAVYASFPAIVKDSFMLFFFLQSLKAAASNKRKGFSRGLKAALRRWYLSLTPAELLLELWHTPAKYGWAHKDVLKLAHLTQKPFALGSRVILQWYFTDLQRTKVMYVANKEAAEYVGWLDDLFNKEHETSLPVKRMTRLLYLSGDGSKYRVCREQDPMFKYPESLPELFPDLAGSSVTLVVQDSHFYSRVAPQKDQEPADAPDADEAIIQAEKIAPPPSLLQSLTSTILLERLKEDDVVEETQPVHAVMALNNFVRRTKNHVENLRGRNKWRKGMADPHYNQVDCRAYRTQLPEHLQPFVTELDTLVMRSMEMHAKSELLPKLHLVLEHCDTPTMFLNCNLGTSVHKQIRVVQAMFLLSRVLCHRKEEENGGLGERVWRPYNPSDTGSADTTPAMLEAALQARGGEAIDLQPIAAAPGDFKTACAHLGEKLKVGDKDRKVVKFGFLSDHCESRGVRHLVYCSQVLSADQINEAYTYMREPSTDTSLLKVVLLSVGETLLTKKNQLLPNVLVLNGFNTRTLDTIVSFLDDSF